VITIEYSFGFDSDREDFFFTIELDDSIQAVPDPHPCTVEWARLDYCQCEICPFSVSEVEFCPIARNVSGLAATFADVFSIEEVHISVRVEERIYMKTGRVTDGLRSLLGLYMATSGCPHMAILRPMARFHLPFASMEETIFRHFSCFFMRQYFEYQKTGHLDFSLERLSERMALVDKVNRGICRRLEVFTGADANRNALTILNSISMMLDMEMSADFDTLRPLFDY